MGIPTRLGTSHLFERPEGSRQMKRIVFLSVEGNKTERNYFNFVNQYREKLGIEAVVRVEVLERSDTSSAPQWILNLLEEYIDLRNNEKFIEELKKLGNSEIDENLIHRYLENQNSLSESDRKRVESFARENHLALNYWYFLNTYKGESDAFGVVLDRDVGNHSTEGMKRLFKICKEEKYHCFLTTPCFEFWLLLHVKDIDEEEKAKLNNGLKELPDGGNSKVAESLHRETQVGKAIQRKAFEKYFLPNIDKAIERSNLLCTNKDELLEKVGSNIGDLFNILREKL